MPVSLEQLDKKPLGSGEKALNPDWTQWRKEGIQETNLPESTIPVSDSEFAENIAKGRTAEAVTAPAESGVAPDAIGGVAMQNLLPANASEAPLIDTPPQGDNLPSESGPNSAADKTLSAL